MLWFAGPPMEFPIRVHPLLVPFLLPIGAVGARAVVRLAGGRIRVTFGVLFDHTFPLEQVVDIRRSGWPWWRGLGLRVGLGGRVGLIGSTEGVVCLRFRVPQRVRVVVPLRCTELHVSVVDPEGLLATCAAEVHQHSA